MEILIFLTIVALAIMIHIEIEGLKSTIEDEKLTREFYEKGDY